MAPIPPVTMFIVLLGFSELSWEGSGLLLLKVIVAGGNLAGEE